MTDAVIKNASEILAAAKKLATQHSADEQTALWAIALAWAASGKNAAKTEAKPAAEKKTPDVVGK